MVAVRQQSPLIPTAERAVLHTAIQEHLDSRREAVDTGLDSLEGLLVRNRVRRPGEHHQTMLNERKRSVRIKDNVDIGWIFTDG